MTALSRADSHHGARLIRLLALRTSLSSILRILSIKGDRSAPCFFTIVHAKKVQDAFLRAKIDLQLKLDPDLHMAVDPLPLAFGDIERSKIHVEGCELVDAWIQSVLAFAPNMRLHQIWWGAPGVPSLSMCAGGESRSQQYMCNDHFRLSCESRKAFSPRMLTWVWSVTTSPYHGSVM
jgi:hypothetical protein